MTQENHDNAERFLKQKYGNPQTENEFGWNEVISILAEYTERIKPSIIKLQSKLSEKDKEINALKEQLTPIPVSERLPDNEEDVLVYYLDGSKLIKSTDWYNHINKEWQYYYEKNILAWLPIPELKK